MKKIIYLLFMFFTCGVIHASHKVRFVLNEKSPRQNKEIYLAGTFNDWDSTANPKYRLQQVAPSVFEITLDLNPGPIRYKFHRGDWKKVELRYDEMEVEDRELIIGHDTILTTTVRLWKDQLNVFRNRIEIMPDMFPLKYGFQLSQINSWYFRKGNDASWAIKDLNNEGWQKIRPIKLDKNKADASGRIEGWFRTRILLDSSLAVVPLWFNYQSWASAEFFLDGKLIHRFGEIGKEYHWSHKLPIPLPFKPGKEHVLAFHFVDQLSPIPPNNIKVPPSIFINDGKDYDLYVKHVEEEPIYFTIWIVVGSLLTVLFWFLSIQNPKERNLTLIAITSTWLTYSSVQSWIPHCNAAPFLLRELISIFQPYSGLVLVVLIPLLIGRIFKRSFNLTLKILVGLLIISVIVAFFYNTTIITTIISIVLFVGIKAYIVFTSWKNLRGAQWAVVGGIGLTLAWFLAAGGLGIFSVDLSYQEQSILDTGLLLSFPLSLLVYIALRFREMIREVEEKASRVVQLSEERREQAENQQKVLEAEVARQTTELRTSLDTLKSTQSQLIQSEKMASLGELTAGIAHEIQNPLNFVNNFSEVSNELLTEMKEELEKGNIEDVKSISEDVQQNLEKILHHGKRADAIVKGMLQHSRSSSGKKEPTDINALADEYLRLAYHGFRAKDKTFNAKIETDFDETIGKINVIPQDIGRVILILITNAFYAVDEKKKTGLADYEPMVSVSTKRIGDKIEISVKDNGNGIPPPILDKIFQPFFTTKPTGQGTGLGLSLSYDIVKAHGGNLEVFTTSKIETTFLVTLSI